MKGFKQFGTIALAAALTITFAVPVKVNATYYDYNRSAEYTRNAEGEIIDTKTKSSTYTNKVTNESYTFDYATGQSSGDMYKATHYNNGIRKGLVVGINDYNDIRFTLDPGAEVTKIKVTKGKGNINVKQSEFKSEEAQIDRDSETKKYYYRKVNGDKEELTLTDDSTTAEWEAVKRMQNSYEYRVWGKKKGESVVAITVKDAAGATTTTKVKVSVSEDERCITQITYAGKNLKMNYNKGANNNNYYACQSAAKSGNFYVTKKSGKLKVTMGKNYKFIAAYVIKPNAYTTKTQTSDDSTSTFVDKSTTTYATRQYSYGIDLNGDGDYEDTIDGIREQDPEYKNCSFVKVKNNSKISLNTVPYKEDRTTVRTYGETGQYTTTEKETANGNMAYTTVILVCQDKLTKEFVNEEITISLRTSKQ
ncbi:hypothetical protein [Butyrivibrio sp. INlla16]|uniref:hypothetical protein n=1 Tax=Butyrivibrio sp. INlla16 TaxID=1520807 RepID=UPI0008912994|nr:hypothetical protein [Butyrivibrio sp. INlla16]SDB07727.1 hypothetical protein SAMN02910263_00320 [Butyrivibrio sp. INlla16]